MRDAADTEMIELELSSVATTVGCLLELVDGASTWTLATSSSNARTLKAVAQEVVASGAAAVKAILVNPTQLWVAATTNNAATADTGDRMVLTDNLTVNNTGTDSTGAAAVFQQIKVVGATTEKRILGRFTGGYGNATV